MHLIQTRKNVHNQNKVDLTFKKKLLFLIILLFRRLTFLDVFVMDVYFLLLHWLFMELEGKVRYARKQDKSHLMGFRNSNKVSLINRRPEKEGNDEEERRFLGTIVPESQLISTTVFTRLISFTTRCISMLFYLHNAQCYKKPCNI